MNCQWRVITSIISIVTSSCFQYLVHAAVLSTYRAAVVEYKPYSDPIHVIPITKQAAQQNMMKNLRSFETLMQQAHVQDVQLIVFPEYGITGPAFVTRATLYPYLENIPVVSGDAVINPCLSDSFGDRPVLKKLSCMAREYTMVLVANMGDVQECSDSPDCPPDGHYQLNTDVVFDSDGSLLAKYHKTHLTAREFLALDFSPSVEVVTFKVSFGIEFGIFTCYDIGFCEPPFKLIQEGVKNVIFPTFWPNGYPMFISSHLQQGWSWRTGVNFIGADQHEVTGHFSTYYATGSGIYSAGFPLMYYISGKTFEQTTGHLSVADVPVDPATKTKIRNGTVTEVDNMYMRPFPLLNYSSHILTESSGSLEASYTNDRLNVGINCKLDYAFDMSSTTNDAYVFTALVVDADDNSHNDLAYAVCSLAKCGKTCGEPPSSTDYLTTTSFTQFSISGDFSTDNVVMPTVVGNGLSLLDPSLFVLTRNSLSLKQNTEQLILSANLYARVGRKCSL